MSKPTVAEGAEKERLKGKKYAKELRKLQTELCVLQEWVKHKGLRVIIVFEGRDAAGKGGTIKAITERVSPRVFRVVALPPPAGRGSTAPADPSIGAGSPPRWVGRRGRVVGALDWNAAFVGP